MNGGIRLAIGAVLGIAAAAAVFGLFSFQQVTGTNTIYFSVPLTLFVLTYLTSFGANVTVSAISCSVDPGKAAYVSLIPAGITLLVAVAFLLLETSTGLFSFVFNTIHMPFQFASSYTTASVFGLIFAVFWSTLYGELVASSLVEVC